MSQLYRTLTGQSQQSEHSGDQHLAPTDSVLTKTTTTDPLSGVLNHLTEAQHKKLDDFKARLLKEGWWNPEGVNGKPTHDEGTLLRYLRARKFDVQGAIGQFTDTEKWLKEQHVEELYEHFDVEIYERARALYPQWTGHRDRRGIPIYVYVIKGLDSKHVSKYQKESQKYKDSLPNHKKLSTPAKMLPLFALYHNLLNFVLPMVSSLERPNPEIPVTNSTNIVDISGVGLTQFWNLKSHMQDASVLATAHYPETLDRIFIIGAPSFFPTVWSWIKRWFDPVTVSKIFILGKHEVKPTLEKFMDTKDFPKRYGGDLNWDWGQLPALDDETRAALSKDGNAGWVRGPCLWLDQQRLVVGSENGKLRRPDKEIQEKKPIVYAADYTEVPVHPDRKASKSSGGAAPATLDRKPSHHAVAAANIATGTTAASESQAAAASHSKPTSRPTSQRQSKEVQRSTPDSAAPPPYTGSSAQAAPANGSASNIKPENLRKAPIDDDPEHSIHVSPKQPANLPVQAEYVSKAKSQEILGNGSANGSAHGSPNPEIRVSEPESQQAETAHATAGSVTGTRSVPAVADMNGDSVPSRPTASETPAPQAPTISPHPPGMPQPGPLPKHTVEMVKKVTGQLEGESTSSIPESANGAMSHPEIIIASDKSKGLALEKDKMDAIGSSRPEMQRFVTAAEF